MRRLLIPSIQKDLDSKLVILTGPRQSGKTTLSQMLYSDFDYFNYDNIKDQIKIKSQLWNRSQPLIIFDELHKMKNWKQWLKGIYDKEGSRPRILVTGSAKLNTYRKMGDSLAGRFFQYRLYPLDLKEAQSIFSPEESLSRLCQVGGFPEPFLNGTTAFYKRWKKSHLDIILRQDFLDLFAVRDIKSIEILIQLLKERVGSPVSYSNLARDLERDPNTIKRWLELLEEMYVIFRITPYSNKITRSILKEPKYYFYDVGQLTEYPAAQLENIVALALLKELHMLEDILGDNTSLYYLRTKDGKEIDFAVAINSNITHLIEVKTADDSPSKQFTHFSPAFENVIKVQLVKNLSAPFSTPTGIDIQPLASWLTNLDLKVKN
jgi:predicted AAA+ superfamily ATPase